MDFSFTKALTDASLIIDTFEATRNLKDLEALTDVDLGNMSRSCNNLYLHHIITTVPPFGLEDMLHAFYLKCYMTGDIEEITELAYRIAIVQYSIGRPITHFLNFGQLLVLHTGLKGFPKDLGIVLPRALMVGALANDQMLIDYCMALYAELDDSMVPTAKLARVCASIVNPSIPELEDINFEVATDGSQNDVFVVSLLSNFFIDESESIN